MQCDKKNLQIEAGYANGMMTLEKDTIIMVFSTFSLEESINDDIRYDIRMYFLIAIWQDIFEASMFEFTSL